MKRINQIKIKPKKGINMSFDILDMINEATTETDAFETHPVRDMGLEERLLYLQGLGLVMHADGSIDAEEIEYLRVLIKSFDMDESTIDSFISFAKQPDKDTIQAFFQTFRDTKYASVFILDALMIAYKDDDFDDKEKAVIDKISESLNIISGLKNDVLSFYESAKEGDWDAAAIYFNSEQLDPELYKYILEYYSIDFDELVEKSKNSRRLYLQKLVSKEFCFEKNNWGVLSYGADCSRYEPSSIVFEETEISKSPVNPLITYSMIVPYLQAMFDRGEFKYEENDNAVVYKESIIFDLNEQPVTFNSENRRFQLPQSVSESHEAKNLSKRFYIKFIDSPIEEDCSDFALFSEICYALYGGKPAQAKPIYGEGDYFCDEFLIYPRCDEVAITNSLCKKENKEGILFNSGSMCFGVRTTRETFDKSRGSHNYESTRERKSDSDATNEQRLREDGEFNKGNWRSATFNTGDHVETSYRWITVTLSLEELFGTGCYIVR
jgi:uncharacterized tellurite resistance protein B-like protein